MRDAENRDGTGLVPAMGDPAQFAALGQQTLLVETSGGPFPHTRMEWDQTGKTLRRHLPGRRVFQVKVL